MPDAAPPDESPESVEPDDRSDIDPLLFAYEERLADQRAAAIAAGRRKGGAVGAAMAGAMLAISDIIEGPPKDKIAVTVEASSDPHDLDKDGFDAKVGDVDVEAPPLAPLDPVTTRKHRR